MINSLKERAKSLKKSNFILFNLMMRLWRKPYLLGIDFIFCYLYSTYLSYRIFGFSLVPKVFFSSDLFRVVIDKSRYSIVRYNSKLSLVFESFMHGTNRTVLTLGQRSIFEINNTFHIGNGCSISLSENATLTINGELSGRTSGITCDTKIICTNNISIKASSIISWGCYITDTANHYINGKLVNEPVIIGENVWISEGCTIAPGTSIGKGSIIGSKSYVKGQFPDKSLIVGCPAVVKRSDIEWER